MVDINGDQIYELERERERLLTEQQELEDRVDYLQCRIESIQDKIKKLKHG